MATVPKYNGKQRTAMQRKAGTYVAAARGTSAVSRKAAKSAADKLVSESLKTVNRKKPVAQKNVSSRLKKRAKATQRTLNGG